MSKLHEAKHHINVKVDMDELDLTSAEAKATYKEIEEWVQDIFDFIEQAERTGDLYSCLFFLSY